MKLKKEFVIRHMNVLRFLLIVTMLISLTSIVLENDRFTTQVVLGIDQKHNYNETKIILTTDKTRPLSSNIDEATTKNMKMNHNLTAVTTTTHIKSNSNIDGKSNDKIVILTFGDIHKSQYTTVKPILDRYGFKGSFFVTCGFVNDNDGKTNNTSNKSLRMSWNDILALERDGQDIESKGMIHRNLIYYLRMV